MFYRTYETMTRRYIKWFYMFCLIGVTVFIFTYSSIDRALTSLYKRTGLRRTLRQNGISNTVWRTNSMMIKGTNKSEKSRSTTNTSFLVESIPQKIFFFSAFAIDYHSVTMTTTRKKETTFITKSDNRYSSIKLIAWTHKNLRDSNFYCCLRLNDTTVLRHAVYFKVNRGFFPKLEVSQFLCKLPVSGMGVAYASLVVRDMKCPKNVSDYVKPVYPPLKPESGIALCCKIVYGSVDSSFLVEWFELQRLLGVSKAVFYTFNLTDDSLAVLNYYRSIGLAELYPFDYPEKEKMPRSPEDKEPQVFTDGSATVFDCLERVRRYQFVSIMDIDEVILPGSGPLNGSLPRILDVLWKRDPKLGAIILKTKFHFLEGDVSSREMLLTAKFNMCSNAVLDRPKNVFKPHLVQPGAVTTHELVPYPGYKWKKVSPNELAIHHYRRPRNSSLDDGTHLVHNYTCPRMKELSDLVKNNVHMVLKDLGLPNCFDRITKQCMCDKCKGLTEL